MEQQNNYQNKRVSNIVLVGLPGVGKSSIGFVLSKLLGYGFLDVDQEIEKRKKKSILEIFNSVGETEFRKLEQEVTESCQGLMSHVISAGGGTIVNDRSREILQSIAHLVWIDVPLPQIAYWLASEELQLKKRPMFSDVSFQDNEAEEKVYQRLEKLYGQREGYYQQADLIYDHSFNTADFAAKIIKKNLIDRKLISNDFENFNVRNWSH